MTANKELLEALKAAEWSLSDYHAGAEWSAYGLEALNKARAAIAKAEQAERVEPDEYEIGFRRGLEASASYKAEATAYKAAYFKLVENVASMKVFEPAPPIFITPAAAVSEPVRMERVTMDVDKPTWSSTAIINMPTTELYKAGDAVLCWVNEGDFWNNVIRSK